MAHYDQTHYPELLAYRDTVTFTVIKRGLPVNIPYRVADGFLEEMDSGNNLRIFEDLGLVDDQFEEGEGPMSSCWNG